MNATLTLNYNDGTEDDIQLVPGTLDELTEQVDYHLTAASDEVTSWVLATTM